MSVPSPHTVAFVVLKGKQTLDQWAVAVEGDAVTPLASLPDEADVTFTIAASDAEAVKAGELDVAVGFMRGQIKMAGDNGALLTVLPALSAHRRSGAGR